MKLKLQIGKQQEHFGILNEKMLMNTKQELIENFKRLLLEEDASLDFLNKLEESELKTLIASIRHRLENQQNESKT